MGTTNKYAPRSISLYSVDPKEHFECDIWFNIQVIFRCVKKKEL